jgi:plasmid stabilization system protein ParE
LNRWVFSPQGSADLFEIWLYLEQTAGQAVADRMEAEFYATCDRIAEYPMSGHTRPDVRRPVRFWTIHKYLIIYWPDTVPIEILRLAHGAQDIPRVVREIHQSATG